MTSGRLWLVYACRTPYALEVAEIIWRCSDEIAAQVDNLPLAGPNGDSGLPPSPLIGDVIRPDRIGEERRDLPAVIPLLTPGHRFAVVAEARAKGISTFPALVDPTSVIARSATIGEGSVVNCSSVIGANTSVGDFVHVNRSVSVGHDADVADFATLGPGCVLTGSVSVGRGAFVGAGATCLPGIAIGPNALVGAGAVVTKDVPDGCVVTGNPARVVEGARGGYGGVSVPP